MANTGLEVRETGRVLRVQTETPHLVSTGSGRLSVAVTLHPLPEGRITLGSGREADISVSGTGIEPIHCAIENENNVVTLYPISGKTAIDGVLVNSPVRLAQGCMLSFGRSSYMRFNHPAEAKQLKSVLPNSRISMAPISFSLGDNLENHLERKPPVAPRKSPRNSYSEDEGFLGKLTKFEMLARQGRNAVCVSPKVFPAGSGTANVPADQILGYSRSPSLASLSKANNNNNNIAPLQNLTNFDVSRSNTPTIIAHDDNRLQRREVSRSPAGNGVSSTSVPNHNNLQAFGSQESFGKPIYKQMYHENNNENNRNEENLRVGMSQSLVCQRSSEYDNFGREYDMSQSLIVAKTTTEYFQVDQFGSNPNLRDHENGGLGLVNGGSNPHVRRIHPPSPAFNRNPKYSDQPRRTYANYARVKSPTPSAGSGCSIEELRERQIDAENKRKEAESRRRQAQEERMREQEVERQEKLRLEEILAMCAEYERQSTVDQRPRQPNRIKTNGSLPREKRPGYNSPFDSPIRSPSSSGSQQSNFSFSESSRPGVSYENVNLVQGARNGRTEVVFGGETSGENGNETIAVNYENVRINEATSGYGKIQVVNSRSLPAQNYENFSPTNGNLRPSQIEEHNPVVTKNNATSYQQARGFRSFSNNQQQQQQQQHQHQCQGNRKNGQLQNSCEVIENKLAISNDDLLEAIEQLSMISKSKEAFATPKRNNTERDNAKSNEAKADKAREELEIEDRRKYVEFLQNEKVHIHGNMDVLKRSIADIETQEEEIGRELELEKALLSAEYEAESLKLSQDEGEKIRTQMRINELEREMAEDTVTQANLQAEAKQRVQSAQQACFRIEEEIREADDSADERRRQDLVEKLSVQQDLLESERKAFEDLEFHHLEEEASKLATREELQRYLSDLSTRIEAKKAQLNNLESQRTAAKNTAIRDTRSLERQKLGHVRRLEEGRNRLRAIDDELESLSRNEADNPDEKRSPSREDFDRISRVTTDSPIVQTTGQGSLGRKTIESLKEIERNRQLHLAKQGSQVISEERRRVEELKRRVQDEVRTQWEERKMNCASFNSVESGEESSSYSTGGPTESGSGSSDGADGGTSEKLSPGKSSPGPSPGPGSGSGGAGPSNGSYALLQRGNPRDEKRISSEGERTSSNSGGMPDGTGSRPHSQTSSELDTLGPLRPLQPVKHREKPKLLQQRPLTRYLPIKSESLDLRHHIETAGHQLQLIHDVSVDTTTCCGYLSKMSKKFHHWNKRWFVFDRKRKTLSYYSDSSAKKARGLVYFQSIEEVYVDHLNSVRSPQPSLTFIVKTSARLYHLMAPSPEAMRVWVDVVFTGAEGYHEFDHGV
ncbi:pleckstrin homology-like domain family B member 1 [Neodiprion virginianus]|uniref:pleckstrin homology-like domain family B member 1 n=1 Tax=Neodiprion virginianus TaxID=2961670 RepID=UPI001EE6D781|nr:pleckstrin homology-like domain family B member 1 [Neodiprion virginianus]